MAAISTTWFDDASRMPGMAESHAARFTDAIRHLSGDELRQVAASLGSDELTDEVDWWRATIAIDKVLRHTRCTRQAAQAAHDASHAVQEAAEDAGFVLPDADVTRVARAAADMARGLVAGSPARPVVRLLAEHWALIFATV
jgi:Zn-dependent membrane protease YugP